jgi:hypothetical protein
MKSIDWLSIRDVMNDCLVAAFLMKDWAERSQQFDYDKDSAALHLAEIVKAQDTLGRAMKVLHANDFSKLGQERQPSDPSATSNLMERLSVFDVLARASVGEGARPDFGVFSTAHEAAFGLLLFVQLWVGNEIESATKRVSISHKFIFGITDLHRCSPKELRNTLIQVEKRKPMQIVFDNTVEYGILRAWIHREWAAVSNIGAKPATGGDGPKLRVRVNTENKVVELDGTAYPLTGREESKERLVAFIQALINAKGAPVSATDHGVRTRDIERQHVKIRSLLGEDAKAGSGYRIPLEKLMA